MLSITDLWGVKGLVTALLTCALALSMETGAGAVEKPVKVKLTTTMGDIILELYPDKAPATVANFLQYVKDGFYNGTVFHRVIDGFMIQGGGFTVPIQGGGPTVPEIAGQNVYHFSWRLRPKKPTRAPIKNEADNGLKNEVYTVAMARTSDPDSATSQFFINVADNKALNFKGKNARDWGYTVFGSVVQGKDVVDKIKAVSTGTQGMYENVPTTPVVINQATILSK